MRSGRSSHAALVAFLFVPAGASAQEPLTRVSVDASGVEGNHNSFAPAFSADGRYVAFESEANNLVSGDLNKKRDVFVHDRATGAIVRVSVDSLGAEADADSRDPSLSGDGRFVAFESDATNLVGGDGNLVSDVFVHDRDPDGNGTFDEGNGVTERISVSSSGVEGNKASEDPSISDDGMLVAFASAATNLVTGDTNGVADVFVFDRSTGTPERVSVDSAGTPGDRRSGAPAISADGSFVAFESNATNLVVNDTNTFVDIFLRDRVNGVTTRVSVSSSGAQAGARSFGPPAISADGSEIAFYSLAHNLVSNDSNVVLDVFLHETTLGQTIRVSVDSNGVEGNGGSLNPTISADGTLVAFESRADNFDPADDNVEFDVFLHDTTSGLTTPISFSCAGAPGNAASFSASLSADGSLVAFMSGADDLLAGDTNGAVDVFVRDRNASDVDATWSNYGAGFPGTLGIPTITPTADPVLGTQIFVDSSNSLGSTTIGFLLVGLDDDSFVTNDGGTILVDIMVVIPLLIPTSGVSTCIDIPSDGRLCGVKGYLQTVEVDGGAQFGLSFTDGLELIIGH